MVNLDWKTKLISPDLPMKSPRLSKQPYLSIPASVCAADISPASSTVCSAYEHYVRLPELRKLWSCKEYSNWKNESILKPALQALEITFRFISTVLSDLRSYTNTREWKRQLESLTKSQIQIIAILCEDEEDDGERRGTAPVVDLSSSNGILAREDSSAEVWKIPGKDAVVVSWISEASLLPRLATWHKSADIADKILYSIECEMRRCPYTLGLGEPNLAGKPNLEYDAICKPNELHSLKKNPYQSIKNEENQTLYTTHQILESWVHTSQELLNRIVDKIDNKKFESATSDCYVLERIWKLLAEIEELHTLMDPDDFLKLKNQLAIKSLNDSEAFCFRSKGLVEMTRESKDLKHKVPSILGVEVDPKGGPRIQEAAMKLYREKLEFDKIHLLQALQSIESSLKGFFYTYKQVLVVVMGSLEAKWNRIVSSSNSCDSLNQIFLEPTYFPSLDAAKTFLGDFWNHEDSERSLDWLTRRKH